MILGLGWKVALAVHTAHQHQLLTMHPQVVHRSITSTSSKAMGRRVSHAAE